MTTATDISPQKATPATQRRGIDWRRAARASGYVVMLIGVVSAAASFFVLMGLTPIPLDRTVIFQTMIVNGVIVSLLIAVIVWEIVLLVLARRRGRAASRLHVRIVGWFSFVSVVPAVLLALVAWITLDRGLDNWFSTRTRAIIESSLEVANAYNQQRVDLVASVLQFVRTEAERNQVLRRDAKQLQEFANQVAVFIGFPVFLLRPDGSIVVQTEISPDLPKLPAPPPGAIDAALRQELPIPITPGSSDHLGGIIRFNGPDQGLIYIVLPINPEIARLMKLVSANTELYGQLEAARFDSQLAFALLYIIVAMVVVLFAIWLGIGFANRMVAPIRQLIDATDQVAKGNLAVEVPARSSEGDLGALGATFNKMTSQLRNQRGALIAASEQIDARRRFSEAVLAGATAGVIGIDAESRVTVINRMAIRLLATSATDSIGREITDIVPEIMPLIASALHDERPEHRDQIMLMRAGRERTINVRVTTESTESGGHGYVVTLDDITDLVEAQRTSAWADIARRIAHEIKNPLTPIQLSAERLKRKFGRAITTDRDVFEQCTDTIVRQVADIGRMVDEFSSFARMPKPAFAKADIAPAVRDAVFLMQVGHPDISFSVDLPGEPLIGQFDARLLAQAITNLVKNAAEAITAVPQAERGHAEIRVRASTASDGTIRVDVLDTGIGLPKESRQKLLEPYVTTREKGTGLGLAIVRKIVEEHHGRLELLDRPDGARGALVRISLPAPDTDLAIANPASLNQPLEANAL